ncbi:MAG: hypothetical protein U5O69_01705 [Candidatus Competibacteraceae bacterium]|nr:hypothetical protein [Candidatus Competibacteraceae bacterium]
MGDTADTDACRNGELASLIKLSQERKTGGKDETWLSQAERNDLVKSSKLNKDRIENFKQALLAKGYPKEKLDKLWPLRFDPRLYEPEIKEDPKSTGKTEHDSNNNSNSMETS